MKATFKDINELKKTLSYGQRIRLVGQTVMKLPKRSINLLKKWWKKNTQKLNDYVAEEKSEIQNRKVEKIDSKLENVEDVYNKFSSIDYFNQEGTLGNDYLNALETRKQNLETKKEKAQNKKFGLMRVSLMALKKITSKKINDIQEKRSLRKKQKEELLTAKASLNEAAFIYNMQANLIQRMDAFKAKYGCTAEEYLKNNMTAKKNQNLKGK